MLENRERFNIRIVNISAGGDAEASYLHDPLSQLVEECSRLGITVVCAVGNAGHLPIIRYSRRQVRRRRYRSAVWTTRIH